MYLQFNLPGVHAKITEDSLRRALRTIGQTALKAFYRKGPSSIMSKNGKLANVLTTANFFTANSDYCAGYVEDAKMLEIYRLMQPLKQQKRSQSFAVLECVHAIPCESIESLWEAVQTKVGVKGVPLLA